MINFPRKPQKQPSSMKTWEPYGLYSGRQSHARRWTKGSSINSIANFSVKRKKFLRLAKLSVLSLSFGFRGCERVETLDFLIWLSQHAKHLVPEDFVGKTWWRELLLQWSFPYFNLMKSLKVGDSLAYSLMTLSVQLTFEQQKQGQNLNQWQLLKRSLNVHRQCVFKNEILFFKISSESLKKNIILSTRLAFNRRRKSHFMIQDTIKGFCFISSPSSLYPCLNPHVFARNKNFCIIKFLFAK